MLAPFKISPSFICLNITGLKGAICKSSGECSGVRQTARSRRNNTPEAKNLSSEILDLWLLLRLKEHWLEEFRPVYLEEGMYFTDPFFSVKF